MKTLELKKIPVGDIFTLDSGEVVQKFNGILPGQCEIQTLCDPEGKNYWPDTRFLPQETLITRGPLPECSALS